MITVGPITIDTNAVGASSELTLSGESLITLYVLDNSGSHNTHEVVIEVRPSLSAEWLRMPATVTGVGFKTEPVAAIQARAFVTVPEGSASQSDIYIMAV